MPLDTIKGGHNLIRSIKLAIGTDVTHISGFIWASTTDELVLKVLPLTELKYVDIIVSIAYSKKQMK